MPKKIAQRRSPIHGNGVFATDALAKGERVVQYRGQLLTIAQADDLYADTMETGHTFLFTLNDEYVIDANKNGNVARWINHSCKPNCEPLLIEDPKERKDKDRVIIETLRAIKPGEELTYNYGITLEVPHTAKLKKIWACRCGAKNCTGTMLQDKKKKKAG